MSGLTVPFVLIASLVQGHFKLIGWLVLQPSCTAFIQKLVPEGAGHLLLQCGGDLQMLQKIFLAEIRSYVVF